MNYLTDQVADQMDALFRQLLGEVPLTANAVEAPPRHAVIPSPYSLGEMSCWNGE